MRSTPAAAVVLAVLTLPAAASAGTLTLDACYIETQPAQAILSGFTPNVPIAIEADQVFTSGMTDATGSATLPFKAPIYSTITPGSKQFTMTATEGGGSTPAVQPPVTRNFRVANFAFATSTGTRSPKAKRTWSFSGFRPGRAIYAHFRLRGRTVANFRFGVAKGPCGEYKRKAPGIPVKGRVRAGTYTVQVDQAKTYKRSTRPALTAKTTVFTVFRSRSAEAQLRG